MNKLHTYFHAYRHIFFYLVLSTLSITSVSAQAKRTSVNNSYIEKYSQIAVSQMSKHKIPASITLAQGLLESGAGKSKLATEANNHFGIKCHTDWKGGKIYHNDDRPNECFRKYNKAEDSFTDHSLFLIQRNRYSSLFDLKLTDYRNWARGLQSAGYATDKAYANKLIKLIEDYELYQFDKGNKIQAKGDKNKSKDGKSGQAVRTFRHTPYITHGLLYIVAEEGDSYEDIAAEFDFKVKDLYKYNEVPKGFPISKGDLIYFQNKKKKADKPYYEHVVNVGESMHSISQKYGIKVKNLYKMNKEDYEYVPVEGDILKLR